MAPQKKNKKPRIRDNAIKHAKALFLSQYSNDKSVPLGFSPGTSQKDVDNLIRERHNYFKTNVLDAEVDDYEHLYTNSRKKIVLEIVKYFRTKKIENIIKRMHHLNMKLLQYNFETKQWEEITDKEALHHIINIRLKLRTTYWRKNERNVQSIVDDVGEEQEKEVPNGNNDDNDDHISVAGTSIVADSNVQSIVDEELNDGSFDGGEELNDGSYDDGELNDGSFDGGEELNDGSYDDGELKDGSFDDGELNDGSYDDGELNDGSFDDGELNDGDVGEEQEKEDPNGNNDDNDDQSISTNVSIDEGEPQDDAFEIFNDNDDDSDNKENGIPIASTKEDTVLDERRPLGNIQQNIVQQQVPTQQQLVNHDEINPEDEWFDAIATEKEFGTDTGTEDEWFDAIATEKEFDTDTGTEDEWFDATEKEFDRTIHNDEKRDLNDDDTPPTSRKIFLVQKPLLSKYMLIFCLLGLCSEVGFDQRIAVNSPPELKYQEEEDTGTCAMSFDFNECGYNENHDMEPYSSWVKYDIWNIVAFVVPFFFLAFASLRQYVTNTAEDEQFPVLNRRVTTYLKN